MAANMEKKQDIEFEETSSGDGAPQDGVPPHDEMNLQAFLAIVVCILQRPAAQRQFDWV